MLLEDQIIEKLNKVFRQLFSDDSLEVNRELTAADVERWDSLNHIKLILQIEKEFGVKFTNQEVSKFKCVGDLIDTIITK